MSMEAALRVVRDVQLDRLTAEQRDALTVLLLATIAAVTIDGDPGDPWAPVAAELQNLIAVRRAPVTNVIPLQRSAAHQRGRW